MSDGWDEAEDWEVDPEEMARLERNGAFAVILGILALTSAMFVYPSYTTVITVILHDSLHCLVEVFTERALEIRKFNESY